MEKTLLELREEIDKLDTELLDLLSKRISVVKKIGKIKKIENSEIYDKKRQLDVLLKWKTNAKTGNISEELAEQIYKILHDYSLRIERSQE